MFGRHWRRRILDQAVDKKLGNLETPVLMTFKLKVDSDGGERLDAYNYNMRQRLEGKPLAYYSNLNL
jgi:hypothetical protein